MVDKVLMMRKIADLETYLGQIREFSNVSVGEYEKNWRTQRIVERTLQMMIEACTDIASHIVADRGFRPPTGYADTFKVLHENAVIDADLFGKLDRMAKFRNIVVHQYERIDSQIVVGILKRHLADFEEFKKTVLAWLGSPDADQSA